MSAKNNFLPEQVDSVSADTPHVESLTFPELSRQSHLWDNRICAISSTPLSFELDSRNFQISLKPQSSFSNTIFTIGLVLNISGNLCTILLSDWPNRESFEHGDPINNLDKLPHKLKITVIESVLAPFLDRLEKQLNTKVNVEGYSASNNLRIKEWGLGFELIDQTHNNSVFGAVSYSQSLQPVLERIVELWPAPGKQQLWANLKTRMRIETGSAWLSLEELHSIEKDDVILVEQCHYPLTLNIRLCVSSKLALTGTIDKHMVTIDNTKEINMNPENSEKISQLEEMNIKLSFDVGEKWVSINELQKMQPGYSFELDTPIETMVKIRNHDQCIGYGELIKIDHRVGVRIVKLLDENLEDNNNG